MRDLHIARNTCDNPGLSRSGGDLRGKGLPQQSVDSFQGIIYAHYRKHARALPWRLTRNPYRILVSEIMLQQTKVERVIDKYKLFIRTFPGFVSLANAPFESVLRVWQGLGYNKRALALHRIAGTVIRDFRGKLPDTYEALLCLPGIGPYTASAIMAFAFERPSVLIETNIRRVFIHFFFRDSNNIRDDEILPLIEMMLDTANPRQWYYALMDYGVMLGKSIPNPNRRSAHHKRQKPFQGSNRQLRGMIIRSLLKNQNVSRAELIKLLGEDPRRAEETLRQMSKEGLIKKTGRRYAVR